MKRFRPSIFFTTLLGSVLSCTEEEPEIITHTHNATVKVNVFQEVFTGNGVTELPVSGAYVVIYESEFDRENQQDAVLGLYSDAEGLAVFYNLDTSYYYLTCSHPGLGILEEEVSTPDGTISFVNMIY